MGNCVALRKHKSNSRSRAELAAVGVAAKKNLARVVNSDGEVSQYGNSMLVQDVLVNVSGPGVVLSQQTSQHFPPNYELKTGHVYDLIPTSSGVLVPACNRPGSVLGSNVKSIKVIITKQQLRELLSKTKTKTTSVVDMLPGIQEEGLDGIGSSINGWRPSLETIPEE